MDPIPPGNSAPVSTDAKPQRSSSLVWVYAIAFAGTCVIFGAGIYLAATGAGWALLAAGCASLVGVLVTWPLASLLAASRHASPDRLDSLLSALNDRLLQFSLKLDTIAEQQLLSDLAKSIAFREKDREALRRAIRQDLDRKDWEAAMVLVDDMERAFGYKQEADRIRLEINAHRADVISGIVVTAAQTIEQHCRNERWADAQREAEKLLGQFPNHEQVQKLPQEIEAHRRQFKKQLIDSWHDAVERKDVDGSIAILKQLDTYLSPMEAAAMQDAARNIFKEKIHGLSAEFEQAVKDHKWAQAVRIGDQVMRDFPNSGIARELRERMESLRKRAGGEAVEVARV